jgi:glycosylphosphatidylinositol transamidase (GPIT) subunit GPI8/ABC-type branched-subunit amino acid transport system substrate-binding protein
MKTIKIYLAAIILALTTAGCHNDDHDTPADPQQPAAKTTTLNIDVILPSDIQKQWQNSIDWALENIAAAQKNLGTKIDLNLRYHDEDTEDLDRLAYDLSHPAEGDDTCHAIIGPYHSSNANTILRYAGRNRLPVVMPTCTSSELQRTNARNTYAWFLTESDITQCEMMVATAASANKKNIALIYTDDTYGQSFRDWTGYYATELQCSLIAQIPYDGDNTDLAPLLQAIDEEHITEDLIICYALSDIQSYSKAVNKVSDAITEHNLALFETNPDDMIVPYALLTDVAFDTSILDFDGFLFSHAIAPYGSPTYGFPQTYEAKFSSPAMGGYAQMYDALTIIALGAAHQAANGDRCLIDGRQVAYTEAPYNAGLTDHMRSVVANGKGASAGWDASGLALAFREIANGKDVAVVGATGSLTFDNETYTKILNTTYLVWTTNFDKGDDGEFHRLIKPLIYLSTKGSNTQASTTTLWQMDKQWNQQIDDITVNHNLPALTDRWAVIISPSTTWANYRHQADAFAMYQTLRSHGYDDDHIVLIVEDNLAQDSRNLYPGEIFVERDDDGNTSDLFVNDDVRLNAVVDYHFSDLTPDDIADIMLGHKSDRLPHVISPTSSSDVLFFWSGHGGSQEGPLWGNEDAAKYFGKQRIRDIVDQMNQNDMYRRMMFAIETCYSGKWGEALDGLPDVLVLTAATPSETSKADMYNSKLGVYLSNAFARTFRRQIYQNPDITVYNLYRELFKTTKGSHVTLYNQQNYGSVYSETMREFLE